MQKPKKAKNSKKKKKKKKSPITESDAQIPSNYSSPITRKIFDEIFIISHCAWCLQAKSTKHNGLTDSKINKIKQLKLWNRNL